MEIISLLIRHTTEYDIHIDSVGSLACQIDSTHVQGTLMHLDMLVYSFVEGVQVGEGQVAYGLKEAQFADQLFYFLFVLLLHQASCVHLVSIFYLNLNYIINYHSFIFANKQSIWIIRDNSSLVCQQWVPQVVVNPPYVVAYPNSLNKQGANTAQ